jgi:hypothetical protein
VGFKGLWKVFGILVGFAQLDDQVNGQLKPPCCSTRNVLIVKLVSWKPSRPTHPGSAYHDLGVPTLYITVDLVYVLKATLGDEETRDKKVLS